MLTDPNIITSEILQAKFLCPNCDFKCFKLGDWNRHLSTGKHKRLINPNNITSNYIKATHSCNCGKVYKHMSSLCAHKKKCKDDEIMYNGINIKDKDALVLHLLQENSKLTNKIIEMAPQSSITNNTNNSNSHNTNNNNFGVRYEHSMR